MCWSHRLSTWAWLVPNWIFATPEKTLLRLAIIIGCTSSGALSNSWTHVLSFFLIHNSTDATNLNGLRPGPLGLLRKQSRLQLRVKNILYNLELTSYWLLPTILLELYCFISLQGKSIEPKYSLVCRWRAHLLGRVTCLGNSALQGGCCVHLNLIFVKLKYVQMLNLNQTDFPRASQKLRKILSLVSSALIRIKYLLNSVSAATRKSLYSLSLFSTTTCLSSDLCTKRWRIWLSRFEICFEEW